MLLNFMVNDANYLIYIFYITHNVQLGHEHNYINLISIFRSCGKMTHVKCKVIDIFFHITCYIMS